MKRWSAIPLYAVAVVWLLWAWLLPLYNLLHCVLLLLLSVGVYFALALPLNRKKPEEGTEDAEQQEDEEKDGKDKKKHKKKKKKKDKDKGKGKGKGKDKDNDKSRDEKDEKPGRKSTGDPELDQLILDRDRAVSEMRRLNDNIPDETLSAQIDDLEATTGKIIDCVLEHPEKLPQIRKFMNYYLPTTLKLLNVYDRMGEQGVREENIGGTMEQVEDTFGRIVSAYHKQLDALFRDEALDVSTDITVMESLLKQEGFLDDRPGTAEPAENTESTENKQ